MELRKHTPKLNMSYSISKLFFVSVPSWNHGIYQISINLFFFFYFPNIYIFSINLFRSILIISIDSKLLLQKKASHFAWTCNTQQHVCVNLPGMCLAATDDSNSKLVKQWWKYIILPNKKIKLRSVFQHNAKKSRTFHFLLCYPQHISSVLFVVKGWLPL